MAKTFIFCTVLAVLSATSPTYAANSCQDIFESKAFKRNDRSKNPLYQDLLKLPFEKRENLRLPDDLAGDFARLYSSYSVRLDMNQDQRLEALKNLPIADIYAASGHRALRNPQNLKRLVEYIKSSNGGDFDHDPILINVITRNGRVHSVDLWNAHHRLIAYLEAGFNKLGEIPRKNFKILVDGYADEHGWDKWGHYLSSGGITLKLLQTTPHSAVPAVGDIRPGTISVDGGLSNYDLGSRNTVGQLAKNTLKEGKLPKVGVYFGTFNPVHEGHIDVVMSARKHLNLDEVIVIPNGNVYHKAGVYPVDIRIDLLTQRIRRLPGINLMIRDTALIVDRFGRLPLMEKIKQTYGTDEIYQIIGQDSYEKLIEQGQITPQSLWKYLVLPRDKDRPVQVPDHLKDVVKVALDHEDRSFSSTLVRNTLKKGERVSEEILHPSVSNRIEELGLFRD